MERNKRRFILAMIAGIILLLVFAVLSLRLGAVPTPFSQLYEELLQRDGIVYQYRLPRLIIGILIGINMAMSGSILQGVTRNPLAAPDIMGITAGGGLATVIILLIFPELSASSLPFFAFAGAVAASLLIYLLAYQKKMNPEGLALSGVAITSGIQAFITLIVVKFSPSAAQALVWLKGSLYARTWEHVNLLWPWTVICALLAILGSRHLNILLLKEQTIRGLGMPADRTRLYMIFLAVALAASVVAVAGAIGFIGLVIPHLARLIAGSNFRYVLPLSGVLGAVLVIGAETLGRIILPPVEIPVGIMTALLGAPYFLYLLTRRKPQHK